MANRDNNRLNEEIRKHIALWDGTVHGEMIKNMFKNGASYESICKAAQIDMEECDED